jgi:hypothetical protein
MANSFVARCDVFYVDDISYPIVGIEWRIRAYVSDPTGSFTGLDVSLMDKIIMRGFSSTGVMVYDTYRITNIYSATVSEIDVLIEYELPIDADGFYIENSFPKIVGNSPITGSFPIGSDLFYRDFMRSPSTYQHLIDPDYASGISNLNFEQVVEEVVSTDYGLVESPNGVTQRFTTKNKFVPGSTQLFVNGVLQMMGENLGYKEELFGGVWTLWIYFPPESDTFLTCRYLISQIV